MRCVAADGALLASGSSDHAIRVWRASSGSGGNPSDGRGGGSGGTISAPAGMPIDLAGDRAVLEGHAGPVSCLQLTPSLLASGSWDCSVRLWDRQSLECVAMVHAGELALLSMYSVGLSCQPDAVISGGVAAECLQQANTLLMLVAAALAGLNTLPAPFNPSVGCCTCGRLGLLPGC